MKVRTIYRSNTLFPDLSPVELPPLVRIRSDGASPYHCITLFPGLSPVELSPLVRIGSDGASPYHCITPEFCPSQTPPSYSYKQELSVRGASGRLERKRFALDPVPCGSSLRRFAGD